MYKLSIFLKNLVKEDVEDVREHIKAYKHEKWRSVSPSKREFLVPKHSPLRKLHSGIQNTDHLSPIRTNTKAERYSGTPHHEKISPTKLKADCDHTPLRASKPPINIQNLAMAAPQIIIVKPKPVRTNSDTASSNKSSSIEKSNLINF